MGRSSAPSSNESSGASKRICCQSSTRKSSLGTTAGREESLDNASKLTPGPLDESALWKNLGNDHSNNYHPTNASGPSNTNTVCWNEKTKPANIYSNSNTNSDMITQRTAATENGGIDPSGKPGKPSQGPQILTRSAPDNFSSPVAETDRSCPHPTGCADKRQQTSAGVESVGGGSHLYAGHHYVARLVSTSFSLVSSVTNKSPFSQLTKNAAVIMSPLIEIVKPAFEVVIERADHTLDICVDSLAECAVFGKSMLNDYLEVKSGDPSVDSKRILAVACDVWVRCHSDAHTSVQTFQEQLKQRLQETSRPTLPLKPAAYLTFLSGAKASVRSSLEFLLIHAESAVGGEAEGSLCHRFLTLPNKAVKCLFDSAHEYVYMVLRKRFPVGNVLAFVFSTKEWCSQIANAWLARINGAFCHQRQIITMNNIPAYPFQVVVLALSSFCSMMVCLIPWKLSQDQ